LNIPTEHKNPETNRALILTDLNIPTKHKNPETNSGQKDLEKGGKLWK
jgi:hypothetical protein